MPEDQAKSPGLNILCIDGGGARGLSSLVVLKEIMHRLQCLVQTDEALIPADYFDFIAGSGTGGISACMLGRLRMPIDRTIEEYSKLMRNAFSEKKLLGSTTYKGKRLRRALRSMIREATGDEGEIMMRDPENESKCKTAVFAMARKNMNSCLPVMFRSYPAVANPGPNCSIWEALYATMAHPDLFKAIEISDSPVQQSFVGGELGCSNPIAHVLSEVKKLYPARHVACILSIGAGHTRTIQVPDPKLMTRMFRTQDVVAMKQIATDNERLAEEMAIRFQDTSGGYFRLNVDQGMQNMLSRKWEQLDEVLSHTGAYLRKSTISNIMYDLTKSISERNHNIPTEYIDGHIPGKPIQRSTRLRRCPAPTPVYTGRRSECAQVETCITGDNERRVCVVHGLGGVGKTQLVLYAIERTRDRWDHLIYMDANSEETIESTLAEFAVVKNIGNSYEDAVGWLESCRERWLVVFDNADDPSVQIRRYIPGGHYGSIIITTRLTDLETLAKGPGSICHVSRMNRTDGLALLIKAARLEGQALPDSETKAAIALLQDFDYFALAIVHAGAYMGHVRNINIAKYRDLFLFKRQCTLERSGELQRTIDDYGKTVYTTWNMCYGLLRDHSKPILWLIAFLHYDGISEDIFMRAASRINSRDIIGTDAENHVLKSLSIFTDSEGLWDGMRFAEVMADLTSCSLIDFDRMNLTYNVHLLVQDWISTVIPQSSQFALECTAALLSLSIDTNLRDADTLIFRRKLAQHVGSISRRNPVLRVNQMSGFATVYQEAGLWNHARLQEVNAFYRWKEHLGGEHPITLTSMSHLSTIYADLGRTDVALCLGTQAVETSKRALGEEHSVTLAATSNLALVYSDLGHFNEAIQLMTRVLDTQKRLTGDEHEDTASLVHGLSTIYMHMKRFEEAEQMEVWALKMLERVLGENHSKTLACMNNLGNIYRLMNRNNEAEQQLTRTVDACKRVLGGKHPNTLSSIFNLASIYSDTGRLDEAEQMLVATLNAYKESLGEEHTDTLRAMGGLASTYSRLEKWDEAESLGIQMLNIRRRVLGEHPDTLDSMRHLASLYFSRGRHSDAGPLLAEIAILAHRLSSRQSTTDGAQWKPGVDPGTCALIVKTGGGPLSSRILPL